MAFASMERKKTIPVSDKNRREMSLERDFSQPYPITKRYCILSSPRSGSTLLGRMLYETGGAGDPQEYFNPPLLQIERERSGDPKMSLNTFMKRMEKRRTSPNGVFGMKLHFYQMLQAFQASKPNKNMLAMLNRFNHLIWIRRRDKLRQAISQAIGQHTQIWSSEDARNAERKAIKIHPFACVRALQVVAGDDRGWEQLIETANLKVHTIWYEDLVKDYGAECREILKYIDIEQSGMEIPAPPIQRQANEMNEALYHELKAYLGWSEEIG